MNSASLTTVQSNILDIVKSLSQSAADRDGWIPRHEITLTLYPWLFQLNDSLRIKYQRYAAKELRELAALERVELRHNKVRLL